MNPSMQSLIHGKEPDTPLIKVSSISSSTLYDSGTDSAPLGRPPYSRWWNVKKRIMAISILATLITLVSGTFYCIAVPFQSDESFGCDPAGNVWVAHAETSRKLSVWNLEYTLFPTITLLRKSSFVGTKAMDICWDIFVGRGFGFLAGLTLYFVFRTVLVDIMKDYPIPQGSVLAMQYSTVSIESMHTHCKVFYRQVNSSRRHWSLRVHLIMLQLIISIAYVLVAPAWLSAMTSYQATMDPVLRFDKNNISFTNLQPCSWGFMDGDRVGIGDNICVPLSGSLHDAVKQYTESQPYLQCYFPKELRKATDYKSIPDAIDQDCDLNSTFILDGNPRHIKSPVLDIRKGTFKYYDQDYNKTHVFNADFLQSDHSICQPSQPTEYEWGVSFPMLFSFMLTNFLLGISVLLTWNVYCDCSWPQQMNMMFGPIRTALVVSTSVREALGDAVDEMSGEDLEHSLSASSNGVKLERAKCELVNQSAALLKRRLKHRAEFPVGSEAYKMYLKTGYNGLPEA